MEYEALGVFRDTGTAIPHRGERSVETVLRDILEIHECDPVYEDEVLVGLEGARCKITLEPGGQLELSGKIHDDLGETAEEIRNHFHLLKTVSDRYGICWLALGLQPFSPVETIGWSSKRRYRIMSKYLGQRGMLAHAMMKQTAAIQVNMDYSGEEDAVDKFRTAMGLSSIITAVSANSPLIDGAESGYLSYRGHIWAHTDPDRCGLLKIAFDPGFSLDDYGEYALDVPMLFIVREGRWIPFNGITFREFADKGYNGHRPVAEDWKLHLRTIFTEVRLKRYLEIRSIDNLPFPLGIALVSMLMGIIYDPSARNNAWKLVEGLSWDERLDLHHRCTLYGMDARFGKGTVLDAARELFEIAREGLKELGDHSLCGTVLLDPLLELLFDKGRCPASLLLDEWNNRWKPDPAKLIKNCAQEG